MRWKCWLPGTRSKPYCLQHWCVFLSSVTSTVHPAAAANLYLTQTLTASRETERDHFHCKEFALPVGEGWSGYFNDVGVSWVFPGQPWCCYRVCVSTYDKLVTVSLASAEEDNNGPVRGLWVSARSSRCLSLTLEVPELGRAKPNFEFLLAGLGQAGPARLKTRKYFASVLFFFIRGEECSGVFN